MALSDWQKTMRRSNVVKAVEETGRQTGLAVPLVNKVLKTFLEQGGDEGWLMGGGQIRKVVEKEWKDDDGETREYTVYTDPDRS